MFMPHHHNSEINNSMKKVFFLLFMATIVSLVGNAQSRTNSDPTALSYKSKEINSALYWQQSSKTGRWESRKNTKRIYLGEGVAIENFNSIFIGEYNNKRYLFLDFYRYSWRYPALKKEWMYSRTIMAALLSDDDYSHLSSLATNQTLSMIPRFYHSMYKGHAEYSFPFFLTLGETLLSATETLYKSNKRAYGEEYANKEWKKDYPPINFIVLKRITDSDGQDVVRFILYPKALPELIDYTYFEVDYSVYKNLLTKDKKVSYK